MSLIGKIKKSAPYNLMWREIYRFLGKYNMRRYDDYEFVSKVYAEQLGYPLELDPPTKLSAKHQWLKLFWHEENMPAMSCKYGVRKYLEDRGYGHLLNELIAVYDSPKEIDFDALPEKFVLKASHGSGWNLICRDKSKLNRFWWKKIIKSWMKQDFYWYGREWNYQTKNPRIIVEKYLEDASGYLTDYKVTCFNGRACYMRVDRYSDSLHTRDVYERSGKIADFEVRAVANIKLHMPKSDIPLTGEELKLFELADELCGEYPYIRIDFYMCNGRVYFGEFTFFTGGGWSIYLPEGMDDRLGGEMTLPEPNYNLELYNRVCGRKKEE